MVKTVFLCLGFPFQLPVIGIPGDPLPSDFVHGDSRSFRLPYGVFSRRDGRPHAGRVRGLQDVPLAGSFGDLPLDDLLVGLGVDFREAEGREALLRGLLCVVHCELAASSEARREAAPRSAFCRKGSNTSLKSMT